MAAAGRDERAGSTKVSRPALAMRTLFRTDAVSSLTPGPPRRSSGVAIHIHRPSDQRFLSRRRAKRSV